jgi:uncharacterized protein (TIGR03435 family)
VLIGADGKVAAVTYPTHLKAEIIEDLMAGRPLNLPAMMVPNFSLRGTDDKASAPPLLDMMVRKSTFSGRTSNMGGRGRFAVEGYRIGSLLALAYHVQPSFVVGNAADDPTMYDVSFAAPGANETRFRELLPSLLCMTLHVTARKEKRDTEGWILKAPNGKPDALKAVDTNGMFSFGFGIINTLGSDMSSLTDLFINVLQKPVADKTGLAGKFEFKVEYDKDHPESLVDALRKLGFTLEPAVLPTDFLVVNKE